MLAVAEKAPPLNKKFNRSWLKASFFPDAI